MITRKCSWCERDQKDDVTVKAESRSPVPEFNISADDVPELCTRCNEGSKLS